MAEVKQVAEQIKEFGAILQKVRTRLEDTPDAGELKEMEARICKDLTGKMVERQELELMKEAVEASMKRFDELETKLSRIGANTANGTDELTERHSAAFRSYLQSNSNINHPDVTKFCADYDAELETRGLSEGTGTEGGFLVPQPMVEEMQKIITVINPLESLARVITLTSGNSYIIPRRTTDIATASVAAKVGEKGKPSAKQVAFGKKERIVHAASVYTDDVSIDFLTDVVEAESIIADWAGEAIGYLRADKFINGVDVGEPEGFLTNGDISTVTGEDTSNNKIAGNDFFKLLTTLKAFYRPNAVFMFNSTVLFNALTLKDSNGAYHLPFSLRDGIPSSIAGKRFYIAETMPSDGTQNNLAVAFGDFKQGYWIANKGGMYQLRDPYTNMPEINMLWRFRYDGAVANAEAIKILKMG